MNIQGQSAALMYASIMTPAAPSPQMPRSAPTPQALPVAAGANVPLTDPIDMMMISHEAYSMLNTNLEAVSGACRTCATRAYVCSDGGVSRPSPGNAAAYVVAHERAHLADDRAEAQSDGNRVVAQNIAIFSATCPECGVIYVSGGEASSLIASEGIAGHDHPVLEVMQGGCGPDGSCCGCGCCGTRG